MERLKDLTAHLPSFTPSHKQTQPQPQVPHPLDPLSASEIDHAVSVIRRHQIPKHEPNPVFFNAVTLQEPRKKAMLPWVEAEMSDTKGEELAKKRPKRVADVVVIIGGGQGVWDGLVDLTDSDGNAGDGDAWRVLSWDKCEGVQPLVGLQRFLILSTVPSKRGVVNILSVFIAIGVCCDVRRDDRLGRRSPWKILRSSKESAGKTRKWSSNAE